MFRAWLPKRLRPKVLGARFVRSVKPTRSFADVHGDVLIVASVGDPTADYFFRYLRRRHDVSSGFLRLEKFVWDSSALASTVARARGIYFREPAPTTRGAFAYLAAVRSVVLHHKNVIAPSPHSTNWSKPLQMAGVIVPRATDCVGGVDTFLSSKPLPRHRESIVKSMSNHRSRVVSCDEPGLLRRNRSSVPCLRQPRINGVNVRAHQVGYEPTFACAVFADRLDYRYAANVHYEPIELPRDVQKWCAMVTKAEGLRFSGIDFIWTGTRFLCLEVNPMPGYDGFERASSRATPISDALLAELIR